MPAAPGPRIRIILLGAITLLLVWMQPAPGVSLSARNSLPSLMLWAWERPSDLREVPADVGVAFLAQTISITEDRVVAAPRRWPLKVAPDAQLSAVTRIEMPVNRALTDREYDRIADAIARTSDLPQVFGVQIDFDATESQRGLYRRVIGDVRRNLSGDVPLSITALASWCAGDRWLDGLPIDEAVPMLFDMGAIDAPYRSIAQRPETAHPRCRSTLGISLGERMPIAPKGRRVYVFNPREWRGDAVGAAREWVRQ